VERIVNHYREKQLEANARAARSNLSESMIFDVANPETLQDVRVHQPLLASGKNLWSGIHFYNYHAPAGAVAEVASLQHVVIVPLASASEDRWMDGKFVKESYDRGASLIIPATLPQRSYQFDAIDVAILGIEPDFLDRVALDTFDRNCVELIPQFSHPTPLILQLALELQADLAAGCPAGALFGETIAHTLTAYLLRHYTVRPPQPKSVPGKLSDAQIQQAIDLIHAHLDRPLPLSELAANANLSPYHFTRLFKQTTGRAPHQYLIHHRLERAKKLLRQKQLSIAQIAVKVGFTDQGHFSKCFSRYMGASPKAYRDLQDR
jgi:AraC family transcriptional regulator